MLLLTCFEVSLSANQITFFCRDYCDVYFADRSELWEVLVRCVVRQLLWSVLEIGIYCEFFKAAQSAGFENFQAFLWYSQQKWPREPWKVKSFPLALSVSKHAVVLRWLGQIEHFVDYDSKRSHCKLVEYSVFKIFPSLNELFFISTVSRKLPPPEQDGRTVSSIVWFRGFERFAFGRPHCCSLQT